MKPSRNKWADHAERDSDSFDRKARRNRKRSPRRDEDSDRYDRSNNWYDSQPDDADWPNFLDANTK
jgi:hypothetical protein